MKRWAWWMVALACALVLAVPRAMAPRPPETHPGSEHRDIVTSWDRSAMPGDITLWARRTVLGYDANGGGRYGSLYLTCLSDSDSSSGRCPVTDTLENSPGSRSRIAIRFTEKRSGMRTDIDATATLHRADARPDCSFDYWSGPSRVIWSSAAGSCAGAPRVGTAAEMKLDETQLARLVAGNWSGRLELILRNTTGAQLAVYTFAFDLKITDSAAVAIYLPEFDHATPSVDLNLRYDPFARFIEGRKVLDMCLYDGLGSQSTYLGVIARDTGARTPGPTGFSVWHTGGGSGERKRLDYLLALEHGGTAVPLANGVEQHLTGIDTARLRLVMLPGMTLPVFCVPTPLTLTTPRFPSTSKDAGHYTGDLQVELRVPTATP